MAIDYNLQIDTKKTPKEIYDLILQTNNFQKNEKENSFFANGLIGSVGYEEEHSQILTQQDFGFIPKVYVWLAPHREEMEEAGMQNMMKVVMTVLQNDSGDAVMLMNGEYIILTRIDGKLILTPENFGEKDKWWNPKEDVPFSDYELRELGYAGQ